MRVGEKAPNALKVFVFFLVHLHKVALSQYQQYHPLSLNILVDCQIIKCKLNNINRSLWTQDIWELHYAVMWTKNNVRSIWIASSKQNLLSGIWYAIDLLHDLYCLCDIAGLWSWNVKRIALVCMWWSVCSPVETLLSSQLHLYSAFHNTYCFKAASQWQ